MPAGSHPRKPIARFSILIPPMASMQPQILRPGPGVDPHVGAHPVELRRILAPEARDFVEDMNSMLVNAQEWGMRMEQGGT